MLIWSPKKAIRDLFVVEMRTQFVYRRGKSIQAYHRVKPILEEGWTWQSYDGRQTPLSKIDV